MELEQRGQYAAELHAELLSSDARHALSHAEHMAKHVSVAGGAAWRSLDLTLDSEDVAAGEEAGAAEEGEARLRGRQR